MNDTVIHTAAAPSFVEYFVAAPDPILGIKSSNLVDRLDGGNWESKALLRTQGQTTHYIYLNLAMTLRPRRRSYCVNTYDINSHSVVSQALFKSIAEALVFANRGN